MVKVVANLKRNYSRKIVTVQARCLTCGTVQTKVLDADDFDSNARYSILCIKCEAVRQAVIVDGEFVFR